MLLIFAVFPREVFFLLFDRKCGATSVEIENEAKEEKIAII